MAKSAYHFHSMEADGRYLVTHDISGILGEIQKTPDDNWRAYQPTGDEVPGGAVYRTRDEAAEALSEASPG